MRLELILMTLALTACAPHVEYGNDAGGVVQFRTSSVAGAMRAADEYCAKFGKRARITSVPSGRTQASFDCI